jgi:hypothetical protein
LSGALDHAFKILSWYENLTSEEIPPSWMWELDWELEDWFFEVDLHRQGKFKDGEDNREQVEMMSNEFSNS